uniref:Uncharacterized protein n=1 Tax=Tarenaya spinosa TaxID=228870 RepID=Q1KUS5_9ROSI|nr:hypothetical protein [Tarenaya spinosa]
MPAKEHGYTASYDFGVTEW